ncbi:unnamed protein product, partial [Symbiodinium pilosum]
MENRIRVRILRGLSSRVVLEVDMDPQSTVFEVMMAIKRKTGMHWRRQRLLYACKALGEAQSLAEITEGPELEVSLVHMDHSMLEPISDRETLHVILKHDGEGLNYATKELKNDRDMVLAAVRQNGRALRHAWGDVPNDEEIVNLAMANDLMSFGFAGPVMRKNRDLAKKVCETDVNMVRYVHGELLKDATFMLPIVEMDGLKLQFVKKATPELIMTAVKQNGLALEFVSSVLRSQPVVMAAVAQNGHALRFAGKFRNQEEVVLSAVEQDPHALKHVTAKDLARSAVKTHPHALKFARSEFLNDADVVSAAFEADKTSLRYSCKAAMLEMIKRYPGESLLKYAKGSLQEDVDVL